MTTESVPPRSLAAVISHIKAGGRVCVRTCTKMVLIDLACLVRFERAKAWLIKEEGDGYRIRSGKSSFYVLPGQLEFVR